MTWYLAMLAVSAAKSVSRTVDSAAVVFCSMARRLLLVDSRVIAWKAPSVPRWLVTSWIALSMTRMASWASEAVVLILIADSDVKAPLSTPEAFWPSDEDWALEKATVAVWPALAP